MAETNPLASVLEALNAQIQTGTFTLDAVKRVDELRQKSEDLVKLNANLNQEKTDLRGRLEAAQKELEALRTAAGDLAKREAVVLAAEIVIAVDKKELELTKMFKDDMKGLLHTALRSPIVQTMMKDTAMSTSTSNGNCSYPVPVEKSSTVQET